MKKLFIVLFSLVSLNLFAQPWKTIKGDGHVTKISREVGNFNSISSHGSIDVEISYGNSNSISIEADDNLIPYIETTIEGNKLIVKPEKNINLKSHSRMVVYISMTTISSLEQSGSGNISGNGAFKNEGKTDISLSGSGNITLGFGTFKNMDLSVSGSGNIKLNGVATNDISIKIAGSGNIDCSKVTCQNAEAKISGSGNAKVNAEKSITAKISGSGNVFYKGSATSISTKIIGSGKAIKI